MAVGTGPRYGSRYGWADGDNSWAAADASGGMNTNLERAEMTLWPSIIDAATAAPPGGPANGDCYIVSVGASGAWAAHDMEFVYYNGASWKFIAPQHGMMVWNMAVFKMMIYIVDISGGRWGFMEKPVSVLNINTTPPGGSSAPDAYLIGPVLPTGAFSGRPNYIAVWTGANWQFIPPEPGLQVWNVNTSAFTHYNGSAWV